MNKNQQQWTVLFLLSGVLAFLWWRQIQEQPHLTIPGDSSFLAGDEEGQKNEKVLFKGVAYEKGERDPLLSPLETSLISMTQATEEVVLPQLNVQGVIWGGERPMCIIDGKVLRVGDAVQEAKILEIKKEGVILVFGGKIFTAAPKGTVEGTEK